MRGRTGSNFYLATHPEVKPRVITRFEPWMALSFSEGSIGGDIERGLDPEPARRSTGRPQPAAGGADRARLDESEHRQPTEPARFERHRHRARRTPRNGKALLLINPHTSFFFRSEAQMVSEEGLNAYGALTWGQFFIYQGFNDKAGWMHTSSSVDNIDEYLETIVAEGREAVLPSAPRSGRSVEKRSSCRSRRRLACRSGSSPPIARITDRSCASWTASGCASRLMEEPLKALQQSYGAHQGERTSRST